MVGRSKEKLDDLIDNIPFAENALIHVAEATDEDAVIDCMKVAKDKFGSVDLSLLQMLVQKALFNHLQNLLLKNLIIYFQSMSQEYGFI